VASPFWVSPGEAEKVLSFWYAKWCKKGPIFNPNLAYLIVACGELRKAYGDELQGLTGLLVKAQVLSQMVLEKGVAEVWLSDIVIGGGLASSISRYVALNGRCRDLKRISLAKNSAHTCTPCNCSSPPNMSRIESLGVVS